MRYIIRSGDAGRHGLFFFMLVLSLTVCLGQEPPAAQKATGTDGAKVEAATQASATPPVPENNPQVAPAAPPKAPEVTAPAVKAPQPAPVSQKKTKGKTPKNSKQAMPTGPGEVTATGVQELPYEIGPEDILYLNVLHQPDVSQQLVVRPDGFVSVRFAGEIKANGLTTQQLADVVTEKLTQYFNHPEVNIQVLRINSKKYYVSGEVRKPGAYALSTPKTVLEALIEAGGTADFAKKKAIYILRGQQKIPFNLNDVTKGKHLEQNIKLVNGDVIMVP